MTKNVSWLLGGAKVEMMIRGVGLYDEACETRCDLGFRLEDRRYDPIVGAGLAAVERALAGQHLTCPDTTAIIGLTRGGCESHVGRVTEGAGKRRPRQAFFVRAGAQTLATYAAMALGCHGPALTVSASAIDASVLAESFMNQGLAESVILIGADRVRERFVAVALLLDVHAPAAGGRGFGSALTLGRGSTSTIEEHPVIALYAAAAALLAGSGAVCAEYDAAADKGS